jgi:SAM-dependent methyltransferase
MIAQLPLPENPLALEVGCGGGQTTVELARHGYTVAAIDTLREMLHVTWRYATGAKLSERIFLSVDDANSLHFADNKFDLAIAIGVLMWLHSPNKAIGELRRVTKPGGYLIFTFPNSWALTGMFDLFRTPLLKPVRTFANTTLGISARNHDRRSLSFYECSSQGVKSLVTSEGLELIRVVTIGFGPFSFFGKAVLKGASGLWLHENLQKLADRNAPVIRTAGRIHIILERKTQ